MGQPLSPRQKAARVLRLLSWLQIIVVIGIIAAIAIPAMTQHGIQVLPVLLGLVFLVIPWFYRKVADAIEAKADWGRTVGIILGALMLLGIPIGTLIGGYLLYCLISGWDE